jgi:hypothetical protein
MPLQKLGCTEGLVDLLTSNFRLGRTKNANLFLQVNDTTINRNDIVSIGLNQVFRTVRLNLEQKYMSDVHQDSTGTLNEFKAVVVDEQPEEKVEVDKASYYVEGSDENDSGIDSLALNRLRPISGHLKLLSTP